MTRVIDYLVSKRDNMLLFALSLLIAVLMFSQIQVGMEPGKEREFDVPLTFANQSDDLTVLQAPRVVRVLASGSQRQLDSLDTSRVRAVVDLTDVEPGVRKLKVDVLGPTQSGLALSPVRSSADIELEAKLKKNFTVELITVGTPQGAYTYTGVTMLPTQVEVSGPESNVPRVISVRAILDLTRIMPNQAIELDLEALGEENKPVPLITINPPRVQALPALAIGPSNRNMLVTPVFVGHPAIGFKVLDYEVSPAQVSLSGESSAISRMTTVNTDAIDLGGLRSTRTFSVQLSVPEGLKATGKDTVEVTVRIGRD